MSQGYYADFCYALNQVREGKKVARMSWRNGAKIYMITVHLGGRTTHIITHVKEDGTNGSVELNSDDLLATDWFVVEE